MIKRHKVSYTDDNKVQIDISGGELDPIKKTITFDIEQASQIGLELTDSSNDAIIRALLSGLASYERNDKDGAMRFALEQFMLDEEIEHYLSELEAKKIRQSLSAINKYTEEVFKSN